jgi:S-adenosyl-L-methionine hydrolase (adenosine-forming)
MMHEVEEFLIKPDKLIFSGVLSQNQAIPAIHLTNLNYWRTLQPSITFQGKL